MRRSSSAKRRRVVRCMPVFRADRHELVTSMKRFVATEYSELTEMLGSGDPAPLRKYDHRNSGQEREENKTGAIEQFVLAQQRETNDHGKNHECESWH